MSEIVVLGGFVFDSVVFPFSVPSSISGGSGQIFGKQKMIGGDRVFDAMGPDPEPIKWSGIWRGLDAVGNDQTLVAMAEAGQQQTLSWGAYFFNVVIDRYTSTYDAFFDIKYSIELSVLPQNLGAGSTSLDDLIGQDMSVANAGTFQ